MKLDKISGLIHFCKTFDPDVICPYCKTKWVKLLSTFNNDKYWCKKCDKRFGDEDLGDNNNNNEN